MEAVLPTRDGSAAFQGAGHWSENGDGQQY